ncbi:MAG: peptidylprolyl isomerase [Pseudomonadota bacterium]
MTSRKPGFRIRHTAAVLALAMFPQVSNATVVEFQTVLGNFEVNLYDNTTPQTVANFLNYVNNGRYTNTVIHRSVPGFITQGGGFTYDMTLPLNDVPAFPAVANEPELANVRGTIAMAKLGNDPNSATSQWFFNLADNTANLDVQNGEFTVFGEVVGNGMDVVDAIAALPRFNFGAPTDELPLRNYTQTDFNNNVSVDDTHLVIISAVVVSDSTVDSAAGLNPPVNTAPPPAPPPTLGGGGGGGGSVGFLGLFGLLFVMRRRIVRLA